MGTFKCSQRKKIESENVEQALKTLLIQSTTGRILIAEISKNWHVGKKQAAKKMAITLLPNRQIHHVMYQIKLTAFRNYMK